MSRWVRQPGQRADHGLPIKIKTLVMQRVGVCWLVGAPAQAAPCAAGALEIH